MSIRIIAGEYKGTTIEVPDSARPTLSRSRQSIFDILESLQVNKSFGFFFKNKIALDCFAGSGALGIEALSRGAKHVYFIDNNKNAISTLQNNIKKIHAQEKSTIIYSDISKIKEHSNIKNNKYSETNFSDPCDIVFLDPPYRENFSLVDIIAHLAKSKWISNKSILIIESSANTYQNTELDVIKIITSRKIGNSIFTIAQIS